MDNDNRSGPSSRSGGGFFEIHVKGHLDDKWSDWLGGLEVERPDNGEMILSMVLLVNANELVINFAALAFVSADTASLLAGVQPESTHVSDKRLAIRLPQMM